MKSEIKPLVQPEEKQREIHQHDTHNPQVEGLRHPKMGRQLANTITIKMYNAQGGGYVSDLKVAYPKKVTPEDLAKTVGYAFMAYLRELPEEKAKEVYEEVTGITRRKEMEAVMAEAEASVAEVKFDAAGKAALKAEWKTAGEDKALHYCLTRAILIGRLLQKIKSDSGEFTKDNLVNIVNQILKPDPLLTRTAVFKLMIKHWTHGEFIAESTGISKA